MSYGLFSVISASILFGLLPSVVKLLQKEGISSEVIVGLSFSVSTVFYVVIAAFRERSLKKLPGPRLILIMLLTGAMGMGMVSYLLSLSYNHIPLGTATLIHFMYPVLVILIMALLFREKFTLPKLTASVLSVLGMLFVTDFTLSSNALGILLAFLSGVFYALYLILNEKAAFAALPLCQKMTFLSLGAVMMFLFQMIFSSGRYVFPASFSQAVILLFYGIFLGAGFLLMTWGIRLIGSSKASFAALLEPVTSVICGILFYQDPARLTLFIGIILILASMIISIPFALLRHKTL